MVLGFPAPEPGPGELDTVVDCPRCLATRGDQLPIRLPDAIWLTR